MAGFRRDGHNYFVHLAVAIIIRKALSNWEFRNLEFSNLVIGNLELEGPDCGVLSSCKGQLIYKHHFSKSL